MYDSIQVIEDNIDTFKNLGNDQKRTYLGKIMYYEVNRAINNPVD